MTEGWLIDGAVKDRQSVTSSWEPAARQLIDGVAVKEVRNVLKGNGAITEVYRADWKLDESGVDQIFLAALEPSGISGWHAHEFATDRLFAIQGKLEIALYDYREGSPTRGLVNELRVAPERPALVVIPPKVWHAVHNPTSESILFVNAPDRAYAYENPDHWRLDYPCSQIPHRFKSVTDALMGPIERR